MKKLFLSILFVCSMALGALPVAAGAVPKGLDHTTQEEWDVLRYTNMERAKANLPLLITFDRMQKMAGVRSDELTEQFSHTRPNGTGPETVFEEHDFSAGTAAENIAMGQTSAKEVVQGWMNSAGHRENILREPLRYMGTGYTKDDKTYWVQLFAGSNVAQCQELTFYENEGYFKLKLKSGIIAYAPYDPASSPKVNGIVTFHFPGAEGAQEETASPAPSPKVTILSYPTKTAYTIGEGFDATGLKAEMGGTNANDQITFYTSGTVELTQGRPFQTKGEKVVELRYKGEQVGEYTVHVDEKPQHSFTDVPRGAYYENPVVWAVEQGVTGGTSTTTFSPRQTCTRAQVATFLWRAKGSPEPASNKNPFVDVAPGDYYHKAVLWAVEQGVTSGTSDTTFGPNDTCTGAQVVTFLWRAQGKPKATGPSDIAAQYGGQYFADAVAWADGEGLLSGMGSAFRPEEDSPRADIVTYLYRSAGSPAIPQNN